MRGQLLLLAGCFSLLVQLVYQPAVWSQGRLTLDRERINVVPRRTERRLSPPVRGLLQSIAKVGGGTGFLVAKKADGRALLLTNRHVVRRVKPTSVYFLRKGRPVAAKVAKVTAMYHERDSDLALVEIRLPKNLQKARPLELCDQAIEREVLMAGFPDLLDVFNTVPDKLALPAAGAEQRRALDAIRGEKQIWGLSIGRREASFDQLARLSGDTQILSLPHHPGNSGSPVVDLASGKVVAIYKGFLGHPNRHGPGNWRSKVTPMTAASRLLEGDLASWQLSD